MSTTVGQPDPQGPASGQGDDYTDSPLEQSGPPVRRQSLCCSSLARGTRAAFGNPGEGLTGHPDPRALGPRPRLQALNTEELWTSVSNTAVSRAKGCAPVGGTAERCTGRPS